jgi:hypothetical protein
MYFSPIQVFNHELPVLISMDLDYLESTRAQSVTVDTIICRLLDPLAMLFFVICFVGLGEVGTFESAATVASRLVPVTRELDVELLVTKMWSVHTSPQLGVGGECTGTGYSEATALS